MQSTQNPSPPTKANYGVSFQVNTKLLEKYVGLPNFDLTTKMIHTFQDERGQFFFTMYDTSTSPKLEICQLNPDYEWLVKTVDQTLPGLSSPLSVTSVGGFTRLIYLTQNNTFAVTENRSGNWSPMIEVKLGGGAFPNVCQDPTNGGKTRFLTYDTGSGITRTLVEKDDGTLDFTKIETHQTVPGASQLTLNTDPVANSVRTTYFKAGGLFYECDLSDFLSNHPPQTAVNINGKHKGGVHIGTRKLNLTKGLVYLILNYKVVSPNCTQGVICLYNNFTNLYQEYETKVPPPSVCVSATYPLNVDFTLDVHDRLRLCLLNCFESSDKDKPYNFESYYVASTSPLFNDWKPPQKITDLYQRKRQTDCWWSMEKGVEDLVEFYSILDGQLCYARQLTDDSWTPFQSLGVGVVTAFVCSETLKKSQGSFPLILYFDTNSQPFTLTQSSTTYDWINQRIFFRDTVSPGSGLTPIPCYRSDIYITDVNRTPLSNVNVTIGLEESVFMRVNDSAVQLLSPLTPGVTILTQGTTDAFGKIIIEITTETLKTAPVALSVHLSDKSEDQGYISYFPDETYTNEIKKRLKDDPEMKNQKKNNGDPLVPGDVPDVKIDAVSKGLSETLQSIYTASSHLTKDYYKQSETTKFHHTSTVVRERKQPCSDPKLLFGRSLVQNDSSNRPWTLDFTSPEPSFRFLSSEECAEIRLRSRDNDSWWGEWGTLWEGIKNGAVKLLDYTVESATAYVHFIYNNGFYYFNRVIDDVKYFIDVVEGLFAQIKVKFQDIFSWIGSFFQWSDIKRTKQALKTVIKNTGSMLPKLIKAKVDSLVNTVNNNLDPTNFRTKMGQVLQNHTIDRNGFDMYTYARQEQSSQYDEKLTEIQDSTDHNPFMVGNRTLSNVSFSKPILNPQDVERVTSKVSPIYASAHPQTDDQQTRWQNLLKNFNVSTNLHQFMNTIFNELVDFFCIIVRGAFVDTLFVITDLVSDMITSLFEFLDQPIQIPYVSNFYQQIIGEPLSLLDLVATVVAVPANLVIQAKYGAPLFKSDEELTNFFNIYTPEKILNDFLNPTIEDKKSQEVGKAHTISDPKVWTLLSNICNFAYMVTTSALDALPIKGFLTGLSFIMWYVGLSSSLFAFCLTPTESRSSYDVPVLAFSIIWILIDFCCFCSNAVSAPYISGIADTVAGVAAITTFIFKNANEKVEDFSLFATGYLALPGFLRTDKVQIPVKYLILGVCDFLSFMFNVAAMIFS